MTMLLTLDTATCTGFAHGKAGDTPTWGAINFGGEGGTGEVVSRFRTWLFQLCLAVKPTVICFEAPWIPRFGSKQRGRGKEMPINAKVLRRLMALVATVEAVAWELGIKCYEVTVIELTRFFTGTTQHGGRDNKKAATIEMCARYGWDTVSDDAADALSIWAMAEAKIAPELAMRRGIGPLFMAPAPEARPPPRPKKRTPRVGSPRRSVAKQSDPEKSSCQSTQII